MESNTRPPDNKSRLGDIILSITKRNRFYIDYTRLCILYWPHYLQSTTFRTRFRNNVDYSISKSTRSHIMWSNDVRDFAGTQGKKLSVLKYYKKVLSMTIQYVKTEWIRFLKIGSWEPSKTFFVTCPVNSPILFYIVHREIVCHDLKRRELWLYLISCDSLLLKGSIQTFKTLNTSDPLQIRYLAINVGTW